MAQELLEDDQKILDGTRSVCQQLGITNYNPVAVAWQALLARGRSMLEIPFDECILTGSQIILPAGMRGKLEPGEWKPIIASTLILSKKLRKQLAERILIGLAGLIVVAVALFLTLPILVPQTVYTCDKSGVHCGNSPLGYMLAVFIGLPLVLIGTPIIGVIFARGLKLVADGKTADLLGQSYFLGVLNKVATIAPPNQVRARKRIGGPLGIYPSLQARIQYLQPPENRRSVH